MEKLNGAFLTVTDEMRQISELICGFVGTVDFGTDFERQLKFFTLCRGKIRLEHVQVLKRSAKLTANSAVSKVMCQLVVRSDRRKLVATRTSRRATVV